MRTLCKINGTDAYVGWGVIFTATSVSQLMSFAPLKPYITNTGALENGTQVLSVGSFVPKVDERDLTLVFHLRSSNLTQFNQRRDSFEAVLRAGAFTLWIPQRPNELYRLIYQSCSQFTQFNGRLAKFTLRVKEPDPTNRALTE